MTSHCQLQTVLTLPKFGRKYKYNICLTTLIGIPGAGKTTFAEKLKELDRTHQLIFNIVHICYDDFILIDRNFEDYADSEQKLWKKKRRLMAWFVKQLLRLYKADEKHRKLYGGLQRRLKDGIRKLSFTKTTKNNILFVIDDNMYYRSMRNDYVRICRQVQVGYFPIFFDCDLDVALQRISNRENKVPQEVVRGMQEKLQKPNPEFSWEKEHLTVPTVFEVEDHIHQLNELLAMKVLNPERKTAKPKKKSEKLQENEKFELILRREIRQRLENLHLQGVEPEVFKATVYELGARKRFVRQKLKDKTIPVPEKIEDVKDLLDTPLFQAGKP